MATKIFVHLPVRDLSRAIAFFAGVGFTVNTRFTDEHAASIVISDDIYAMLMVEPFFSSVTRKAIADTTATAEVVVALGVDSRERVDELVDNALAAGGSAGAYAYNDGAMYGRSFTDPDGHTWEVLAMDDAARAQAT